MDEIKKLNSILRHIDNVKENCELLGNRLIEKGDTDFGRELIANGLIHDNSKLSGIEWLYLHEDAKIATPALFEAALYEHNRRNRHHIEFWGKPDLMPDIYIAELTCDCLARGQEFGDDVREWFKDKFCDKYDITTSSNLYRTIKKFLDMLLAPKFK